MSGKTHCLVSNTITYSFSKHMRAYAKSLVDRRIKWGAAGEETRLSSTNPDRKGTICGIDKYKIDSILTIIACRVAKTISRKVIVILNQHAYYENGKTTYFVSKRKVEYYY